MRAKEDIMVEIKKVSTAKTQALKKVERCDMRLTELEAELEDAENEQ